MTFDLHQLHAFSVVVSTGSLGRAADTLNVTQPALSRTIRRLESQVGAPLFERHSKGMRLTDIGTALLPHAVLLRQGAENAIEEVNALRGLARGTIRVGAVGSIASVVLPMAIDRVLEKWPQLQVAIVEGVWDRLANALTTFEIDLALGVALPDTAEIVAIADCRWEDCSHVVAATNHPLRRKRRLQLADVMDERWALPPRGTGPYEQMAGMFAANGLGIPNIVVETRSITALKSLVSNSGFLSWMSEPMYDTERKARVIAALPIPGASALRALTAFRRRAGILPGPAVKLLDELKSVGSTQSLSAQSSFPRRPVRA